MTQGPENPYDPERPQGGDPYGTPPPPPPPAYGQYGQPQQPPYPGYPMAPMGMPGAPYGVHPGTGIPYSDKQKIVAGLLQILVPFGVGRFYTGDTGLGVAQLIVSIITCGIGCLWPVIDGILILVQDSKDSQGLILR